MRLGDRYKLIRPLGTGSMAEVWAAQDRMRSDQVAIKVISELMALSTQARRRFEREMQAVGAIHHPNVVEMLDHGQVDDGRPFLVMELVDGDTFGSYLKQHGKLGARGVLVLISQVLEGLEAAHDVGIIHRDLKPQNIYLACLPSGKRRVKILDFGVAHLLDFAAESSGGRLTTTGSVVGSPRYMSLEVARGLPDIDQRADIFGVGATMYHALAGHPPFTGTGLGVLLNKIYRHDIPPLQAARPDLPERLIRCVERSLGHKPEERHGSARALRLEVDAIAEEMKAAGE
jgi:serine/threonine-protein kinase